MAPWDPLYPSQPNLLDLVRANAWAAPNLPLFRLTPSQVAGSADDQTQPNAPGATGVGNSQFAPFGGGPLPRLPSNALSPPPTFAANDQAPMRPWWAPGAPTDVFNPWLRGAIESLDKTIRHFRTGAGYGDDAMDSPECRQEWQEARETCAKQMATPDRARGVIGGDPETIEECARGLVSERCGGNSYQRARRPRRR